MMSECVKGCGYSGRFRVGQVFSDCSTQRWGDLQKTAYSDQTHMAVAPYVLRGGNAHMHVDRIFFLRGHLVRCEVRKPSLQAQ